MTLPAWLAAVLPPETQTAWLRLRTAAPPAAYLVGGTALAAHLRHRRSRDLDFFLERPVDLGALEAALGRAGPLVVTGRDPHTLNCVLGDAKVQFLEAADQAVLEPTAMIEGLRVAAVGDLLATKLNAVVGRPAARDYFDLMVIERDGGRRVEEGLSLFVRRYRPAVPEQAVSGIVRALSYLDDVPEDPSLGSSVADLARYWEARVPEIITHLSRS
jgi:hypothetical protein